MLLLRNGIVANVCENTCSEDEGSSDSGEVRIIDERIQGTPGSLGTSPYVVGDLQIISLGKFIYVVLFLFHIIKSVVLCNSLRLYIIEYLRVNEIFAFQEKL